MKKFISLVIPVYNEEESLALIYEEIVKVLMDLSQNYEAEIIFVDDGSIDQSLQILQSFAQNNPQVKIIEFSRNFGKEAAISAGLRFAQGEAVIILDADLQHPPQLIPLFLEKWEKGAQIVIGRKIGGQKINPFRKAANLFFYQTIKLIGENHINLQTTDFRLLDRKVTGQFNNLSEKSRAVRGLIDWLGFKRDFIDFEPPGRRFGQSSFSWQKLLGLSMASLVSHSLFPLKLVSYLGIAITLFSGPLFLVLTANKYWAHDFLHLGTSGTALLAIFLLFLVGIILISQGLMALYIAQIYREVANRPLYIIKERLNFNDQN